MLEFFGKGRKGDPGDWLARRNPYRSALLCAYGVPRLRRLKPVEHLARDLDHWSAHRRGIAVMGLGDTAHSVRRLAAAAALALPALRERLVHVWLKGGLSPTAEAAVDDVLAGKAVALSRLWQGEVTC